jgi:hypothetical protein
VLAGTDLDKAIGPIELHGGERSGDVQLGRSTFLGRRLCRPEKSGAHPASGVVLVDVQDPASPSLLAEHRFQGTLSAARQVGGVLHALSREIIDCPSCAVAPSIDFTWLAFDRSSPRELPRRA